ncbi:MAG TPA: rhodanese-like domain-containing protein [Steroidobacteraceae bacterium]|jgi:rhodanese-related sulfurtransferase|nr:rhodanese-like domain-containing protein [Steroidobacteraceae bacterium]
MTTHSTPIETLSAADVARLLHAHKILLVDVREPLEYASERIQGALLFPLSTFDAAALPDDESRRIVFHCGTGKRSLAAAERRLASGHVNAAHLGGGLAAWKASGLPVITPASSS